jgi:hypothetical protein
VQETGDFELDVVTFPAADEGDSCDGSGCAFFFNGYMVDTLNVPGEKPLPATFINAGIPTIFLNAKDLGYTGTELQDAVNGDPQALTRFETIRAYGALKMGRIKDLSEAAKR